MTLNINQCNRDVKTYGDVIRHMTNDELALFLEEIQAEIELGTLAVMRAKMYPHRKCGEEPRISKDSEYYPVIHHFKNFMNRRISYENSNFGDVWGVENWQDLMQWESEHNKNFGMNVVY